MEHRQPHIIIKQNNKDETIILIDDYELYDFIADYLFEERNLNFESYLGNDNDLDENKWNEMNFGKKYSVLNLKDEINKIDLNEIERIYKLNN
jgi:hypothetical protein